MAPLIFAVWWVISASLVRICPGLSGEQHGGGVGFQTQKRLKLYTFKRINWHWSADTQNHEDIWKPFFMSGSSTVSICFKMMFLTLSNFLYLIFLHVRRSSFFSYELIFLGRKSKDGDIWFVFIHVEIVWSVWFVTHLWAWLLLYEE